MKSLVGLLVLVASLCSCTTAQTLPISPENDAFASVLERYGNMDPHSSSYSLTLSGSALVAAIETQKLLASFGYQRLGNAKFEVISSSHLTAMVCMDLSEVVIINEEGFPVSTVSNREAVFVELDKGLISKFEPLGERC